MVLSNGSSSFQSQLAASARHRIYPTPPLSPTAYNFVQIVIQSEMGIAGGGRGDRVHQIRYTWMMNTTDELRRLRSYTATGASISGGGITSTVEVTSTFYFYRHFHFHLPPFIHHPQSTTRCC